MKTPDRSASISLITTLAFSALSLFFFAPAASSQEGYPYHGAQQTASHQQQAAYAAHLTRQQASIAYQQQMAAYHGGQAQRFVPPMPATAIPVARAIAPPVWFDGRYLTASRNLPVQVQYAITAANCLQKSPYARGRGHRQVEDLAYDCSSSTSYTLIKAGMLRSPLTSQGFARYGEPGPGRFITIWVKPGDHVFMTICGLRLDTSGGGSSEGPRWRTSSRSTTGFMPRHPPGF